MLVSCITQGCIQCKQKQLLLTVYIPGITMLAILIGIIAATAALVIFFYLQNLWASNWKIIILIANFIGIAVCAMHYTAMAGARYTIDSNINALNTSQESNLISLIAVDKKQKYHKKQIIFYTITFNLWHHDS